MRDQNAITKIIVYSMILVALSAMTIASAAVTTGIQKDSTGNVLGTSGDQLFKSPIDYAGTTSIGGITYDANGNVVMESEGDGDLFSSPIAYAGTTSIGSVTYDANGNVVIPEEESTGSPFLDNSGTLKAPTNSTTTQTTA